MEAFREMTKATNCEVHILPVLNDNYTFIIQRGSQAVVVDPAVALPVQEWLDDRKLELVAILQTHHHLDHIGGSRELLRLWPECHVYASMADKSRIPFQTHELQDEDEFIILNRQVRVLAIPGHTLNHLAYYLPPTDSDQHGELFCGDTLFIGGCGRLFEGTAEQMHRSLQRLTALPATTRIWCAHEYSEANLRWALTLAPEEGAIVSRLAAVRALQKEGIPSIPSSVAEELQTNLFVLARDADELAGLRHHKDCWNG